MHNLKELKIWNKSIELATEIYKVTSTFPKEETYGLTSQIRRSAVSIPSNIAEGAGRNSKGEFKQFLGIANGSAYELQSQILISSNLNLIDTEITTKILNKIEEIQKMNYKLQINLN